MVSMLVDVMRSIVSSPSIVVSSRKAGAIGTSYRMNICAERSAMIGNDKLYCSANSWVAVSEIENVTPTKSTAPSYFRAAASTEAASAWQRTQVGAQNQTTRGRSRCSTPEYRPPPIRLPAKLYRLSADASTGAVDGSVRGGADGVRADASTGATATEPSGGPTAWPVEQAVIQEMARPSTTRRKARTARR